MTTATTVYRAKAASSDQGTTLEEHLLRRAGLRPRSALKIALREGRVRVNGKPAMRTTALRAGDSIEVLALEPGELFLVSEAAIAPNSELSLDVALENPDYVVVRKPAGENAHPLKPAETDTTLNALVARYPESASRLRAGRPLEGGLIHRLDRGTSGLLVCARTPRGFERLHALWKSRGDLEKLYLAWVVGHFSKGGRVELELAHDPRSSKRMTVAPTGSGKHWSAVTSLLPITTMLLENHEPATLILLRLHTGVMHQIRATVAHLGHPVLGDTTYPQKLFGPRAGAQSKSLDPATERLLHAFKERLAPERPGPDPGSLPEGGFFLHALHLRSTREPALAAGIRALPPFYFSTRLIGK